MKTNKRRFLAALTASTLALTPCFAAGMMNAVAATDDIGVINITGDTSQHTYNAYPIITGTKDATTTPAQLKDLAWASGFNSAGFISALNDSDTRTKLGISTDTSVVPTIATVDDAAKVLSGITGADSLEALAKVVAANKGTATATPLTHSSGTYTATVDDGWYLVLDETPLSSSNVKVKSANILLVTGTTDMTAKHSLPTLDKVIDDGSANGVDANTAAIGDIVTYDIKTKVPDVTGYDKYYFVVDDILSPGLTYNSDLTVTLGSTTLTIDPDEIYNETTKNGDFYVKSRAATSPDTGTAIKVVFEDAAKLFNNKAGQDIVISYTATLNSDAVITDAGNPNKAKLTYSNDPNPTGAGTPGLDTPDEPPTSDSPTGETPWDEVKTYTTAFRVKKVDSQGEPLTGVKFKLQSTALNEVKITSGESFVQDNTNGTYYKLADGSYTTVAPPTDTTDANYAKYDATNISNRFKKTATAGTYTEEATGETLNVEAVVDSQGFITFSGLKPGTYTLIETDAPSGYTKAANKTITIDAPTPSITAPGWTYSDGDADSSNNGTDTDGVYFVTVVNVFGSTLPETGGIGTKLFYVFGSLFVVGAATFIVTKRRVGDSK